MAGRDKTSVLVALDEVRSKSGTGQQRPQDCGDIGLRIARGGTWYYQDSAIGRKPLVKLFATVLRREDDGRYFLVTPVEKVVVAVEDVPFMAVEMTVQGAGKRQSLRFRTNLDEVVAAGGEHPLSFRPELDGSFTPYILIRDRLKARLTRPAYYELVAAAVAQVKGGRKELGVWSGGVFFPFPATEPPIQD
jgi:uncharacterized protein